MAEADFTREPGIALREFNDQDDGYKIDAFTAFVQSKGLGDECAAFMREQMRQNFGSDDNTG